MKPCRGMTTLPMRHGCFLRWNIARLTTITEPLSGSVADVLISFRILKIRELLRLSNNNLYCLTDQENSTTVTPIRHNIQSPQQVKTVFKVIETGTKRGKLKLVSSRGYTYTFKRSLKSGRDWQCTVRPKVNPCGAIIKEREGNFIPGITAHNHPVEKDAVMATKITKHKAFEDVF